ncbi:hypothetical protein OROGR_021681 [Orobanche gracilis]
MGRKAGTLYINPKKFGNLQKPCMREMISFLNCLALSQQGTDAKCSRQKSLLSACMDAQCLAVKESRGVALTITFRGLAEEENSDDTDSFDGAVVAVLVCVYAVLR